MGYDWGEIIREAVTGLGYGAASGMTRQLLHDEAYEEEKAMMDLKQRYRIEDKVWDMRMADVQWGREVDLAEKKMQHERGLLGDQKEMIQANQQWMTKHEEGNRQWLTEFTQETQDNQRGPVGIMARDLKDLGWNQESINALITASETKGRHNRLDIGDMTELQTSIDGAYEDYKAGDEYQTQESILPFGWGDKPGKQPMSKQDFVRNRYPWAYDKLYPQGGGLGSVPGAGGESSTELPEELSTVLYTALDNAMKSKEPKTAVKSILDPLPDKLKPYAMDYLSKKYKGGPPKGEEKGGAGQVLVEGAKGLLSGEVDTSVNAGEMIGKAGEFVGKSTVNLPDNINKLGLGLMKMYGDAWDLSKMTGQGMIDLLKWAYTDLDKQDKAYGLD